MARGTTSTADKLRASVNTQLNDFRSQNYDAIKARYEQNDRNDVSASSRNSTYLRAAAAVYRASTDSTYKLTDQARLDYNAALVGCARSKGLDIEAISGDDNKIKMDILNKELSPFEVMKYYSKETSKASVADENHTAEENAKIKIDEDIRSVYNEAPQATPPAPALAMSEYMTDDAFKNASEEQRNDYLAKLESIGDTNEVNHLKNSLKNKDQREKELEDKISELEGLMRNPDWGRPKDDDDFKIEQGDLIEYLMKEVILKATSWAANRVFGGAGLITYELLAASGRAAKPYLKEHWETIKDAPGKLWDKFLDKIFAENPKDTPQERKLKKQSKENLTVLLSEYISMRSTALTVEKIARDNIDKGIKEPEGYRKFKDKIINHEIFIDDAGVHYSDPTITPNPKNFADFIKVNPGETPTATQVEGIKLLYTSLQKQFDNEQLNLINRDQNPNNDPDKKAEIEAWYANFKIEKKNNITPPSGPDEYLEAQKRAQDTVLAKEKLGSELDLFNAQKELFAQEYAMHKVLERYREDPLATSLQELSSLQSIFELELKRGEFLFLTAEQKRGKGEKIQDEQGREIDVPSREELIERATKLREASETAFKDGKDTIVTDRVIAPLLDKENKRTTQSPETLIEAIESERTIDNTIEGFRQNLLMRDKELEGLVGQQADCDNRRDIVRKRLASLTGTKDNLRDKGVKGDQQINTLPLGGRGS